MDSPPSSSDYKSVRDNGDYIRVPSYSYHIICQSRGPHEPWTKFVGYPLIGPL